MARQLAASACQQAGRGTRTSPGQGGATCGSLVLAWPVWFRHLPVSPEAEDETALAAGPASDAASGSVQRSRR